MFALLSALLFASPAQATPTFTVEQALARFSVDMAAQCEFAPEWIEQRLTNTQVYTVAAANQPVYQIFEIFCYSGAYNVNSIYYVGSDENGLELVQFAQPELAGEGKNPYLVKGYSTKATILNSVFSPAVNSLGFIAKHRGAGDCFTSGIHKFEKGRFVLKQFEVDFECDGKMKGRKIVDIK